MTCPYCSRSQDEHNFHFAAINAAFHHWPEWHPFQPLSVEHLRGWLYVEAGYVNAIDIDDIDAMTIKGIRAARAVLAPGTYLRQMQTPTGLRLLAPRSISRREADRKSSREVQDQVSAIIADVIGLTAEQLVKEKAA